MDHHKNWSIRVRLEILVSKIGLPAEIRLNLWGGGGGGATRVGNS